MTDTDAVKVLENLIDEQSVILSGNSKKSKKSVEILRALMRVFALQHGIDAIERRHMGITTVEILEWFEDESDGEIYAHMYAEQYMKEPGRDPEKTKIISIKKRDLTLSKDKDAFFHAYGWPGPDYEIFFFNDYGVTWAFKEEDIKKMTLEEWDAYNGRNNNA